MESPRLLDSYIFLGKTFSGYITYCTTFGCLLFLGGKKKHRKLRWTKNSLDGMAGRPFDENEDILPKVATGRKYRRVRGKDFLVVESNTIIFQFRNIYIYIWLTRGRVWLLPDILATGRNRFETSRKMEDQGMSKIQVILTHWVCVYETTRRTFFLGEIPCCHLIESTFGQMCRCLRRHWRMKMWNCWRLMSKEARWKYCKVPGRVFNRSKGEKSICSSQILPATKTYTRINLYRLYVVFMKCLKMEAGSEYNF